MNYLGKLADALIDAGHDVVVLSPILDSTLPYAGSTRAKIIEIPQGNFGRSFEGNLPEVERQLWYSGETWEAVPVLVKQSELWVKQCNATINHPGLMERLREEKFDAGFGESMDWCLGGIFHIIGIDKFAVTESLAYKDGVFHVTQVPTMSSYVPSIMGGSFGDEMSFSQRAFNLFNTLMFDRLNNGPVDKYQKVFESSHPGFPDIVHLMSLNSLYFLNSDPLVDFPRPTAARVIDIGGIVVSHGSAKLEKKWSDILDLRPKTLIMMSFGTFAKAYAMPENYKETIRETARAFPDVTFIWKYEMPEHNVTQGIPNLIESTWMPQHSLLRNPRLSAFVTNCGQGSTTEANYAGVPLLVVPVTFDQIRNAFAIRRAGLGINLHKSDLGRPDVFMEAIREVLENPKYKQRAIAKAGMLNDKPFAAKEIFVRNMEFLAKHGPLRQLDHHGRKLSFVQYYLIDVIAVILMIPIIVFIVLIYFVIRICRCAKQSISRKTKKD